MTAAQPENLPEQLVTGVRPNLPASEEHQWSETEVAAQFNSVRAIPSIRLLSKLSILMSARISRAIHPLPLNGDLEYGAEGITRILEPVLKSRCTVVYEVRLLT